ncbi:hypothetical protein MHYP_G00087240 [Metynnis hypsauchen]
MFCTSSDETIGKQLRGWEKANDREAVWVRGPGSAERMSEILVAKKSIKRLHCSAEDPIDQRERERTVVTPQTHSKDGETEPPHSHTTTAEDTVPSASAPSPLLHTTIAQLRDSLSLLEIELVELKEQRLTHMSTSTHTEPLRDQLSQTKHQLKATVQEPRRNIDSMLQERDSPREKLAECKENDKRELADLKEDVKRELVSLRQEIHHRDNIIEILKSQL